MSSVQARSAYRPPTACWPTIADQGNSRLTAGAVAGANGGTFVFHADGSFTYTPPADFPGFDSAQYTASDAQGDAAKATVNVLSQTGGVVWKFYESVLNRDPDPGGLQYWINDFVNGGKTGDIAAGFFESDELLNEIITGYYQQYLHRSPDDSGLAHWREVWHATGGPEDHQGRVCRLARVLRLGRRHARGLDYATLSANSQQRARSARQAVLATITLPAMETRRRQGSTSPWASSPR